MILEKITIEPFNIYDDPEKMIQDIREIFNPTKVEIDEYRENLYQQNKIIRRKNIVKKNEYGKYVLITIHLWRSEKDRLENSAIRDDIKKNLAKLPFNIEKIELEFIEPKSEIIDELFNSYIKSWTNRSKDIYYE